MILFILLLVSIALSNASQKTCEKFVKLPVKTDKRSEADSACQSYLSNKDSSAYHGATDIHDDQDASPHECFEYIVGAAYKSNGYTWSDGTPIGEFLWTDGEPSFKNENSVVLWHRHSSYGSNDTNVLFTMSGHSYGPKSVVCKVPKKCSKSDRNKPTPPPKVQPSLAPKDIEALENSECEDGWIKRAFCGQVNCYRTMRINRNKKSHDSSVENDICAKKHPGSYLVSIHCKEEYDFIRNKPYYQLTGFHIPQSKRAKFNSANFQWTDGSPVDYVNWAKKYYDCVGKRHPLKPGTKVCDGTVVYHAYLGHNAPMNNIHGGIERALCKKQALSKPTTTTKPSKTMDNTVCDSDWEKKEFCGTINCYEQIEIERSMDEQRKYVENDVCAQRNKGHLVSIHCKEEYEYVRNVKTYYLIGFYLPKTSVWDPNNFRWTDGSPKDYVQWTNEHGYCPNGTYPLDPSQYKCSIYTLVNQAFMGYGDYMNNVYGGTIHALCKKPASFA